MSFTELKPSRFYIQSCATVDLLYNQTWIRKGLLRGRVQVSNDQLVPTSVRKRCKGKGDFVVCDVVGSISAAEADYILDRIKKYAKTDKECYLSDVVIVKLKKLDEVHVVLVVDFK